MLLKEFLEHLGVSQVGAANWMNIPFQRLNAIVKGHRSVNAGTASLLEGLTRWDAQNLTHAVGEVASVANPRARGQRLTPLHGDAADVCQRARPVQLHNQYRDCQRPIALGISSDSQKAVVASEADDDPDVKTAVVESLGWLGNERSFPPLAQRAGGPDALASLVHHGRAAAHLTTEGA